MERIALIVLIACWVLWAWPFFAYKIRSPKRPAQITLNASRWGITLQMIAYSLAWIGDRRSKPLPLLVIGLVIAVLGVVLSWTSIRSLGKQLRIDAGLYSDHELVRTGPYAIVRHPIYAGMLSMYLATALIRAPWPIAAIALAIFVAGTEIRVRLEERLLASRFGKQFDAWKARTPAYIPFLR